MTKKIIIVFILLFSKTFVNAQVDFGKYPSYDSIVTVFFSKYNLDKLRNYEVFTLEKKPKGWFIAIADSRAYPEKKVKSTLFWDYNKNSFLKLDFDLNVNNYEEKNNILKYTHNYFHLFNSMPFYGYISWDSGIINLLKAEENLPDSLLYALARAYSSYASNLLNNYSALSDPNKRFKLKPGPNALSESQLDTFRFYQHKAIVTFNRLVDQNPDYSTFIGSIKTKYSNEIMTAFLHLRNYQNEIEATKELKPGLYSPFQIELAKNTLKACGKNGILFTFGDNDTYPLLYIQAQLKFRQDIAIVNMSLLSTSRYINHFRQTILKSPPLPFSIPAKLIKPNDKMLAILDHKSSAQSLKNIIELIEKSLMLPSDNESSYIHLPTHSFYTTVGNQKIEWDIKNNYIYRSHYMVLDIIYTNQFKRPIHFNQNGQPTNYVGLRPYLKLNGFVYELCAEKKEIMPYTNGWVDPKTSFNYILNTYSWSGLNSITEHDRPQVNNIRRTIHQIANALIKNDQVKKAKIILDKCLILFPNDLILFDIHMEEVMVDYYLLEDFSSGNLIAKQLLKNYSDTTNSIKRKPQKLIRIKEQLDLYGQNHIIDQR